MSWPKLDECYRTVDWSWFNNYGPPLYRSFNVDDFCKEHPEVDAAIIRFCWPSGVTDPRYANYYDGFMRNNKIVMGYGWPNPTKSVSRVMDDWEKALGDRVPKIIWADWEETSVMKGKTKAQLTDHMKAMYAAKLMRFPTVSHGEYSRAGWLDNHIIPSAEIRNYFWWLAHWPYPPPDFKDQAHSFSELDDMLPIDNNFTPYRGRVIRIPVSSVKGWQASSEGEIVPRGHSDMGYFLKSYIDPIYGGVGLPPQTEKAVIEIEVVQGEVEIVVKD